MKFRRLSYALVDKLLTEEMNPTCDYEMGEMMELPYIEDDLRKVDYMKEMLYMLKCDGCSGWLDAWSCGMMQGVCIRKWYVPFMDCADVKDYACFPDEHCTCCISK